MEKKKRKRKHDIHTQHRIIKRYGEGESVDDIASSEQLNQELVAAIAKRGIPDPYEGGYRYTCQPIRKRCPGCGHTYITRYCIPCYITTGTLHA